MALSFKQIKNPYFWAYTAAILFHMLLLVLEKPLSQAFFVPSPTDPPVSTPLTFEFVDVPPARETEVPAQETPLVAERNQTSRDDQSEPLPESHLTFADGLSRAKEVLDVPQSDQQPKAESEHQSESKEIEQIDPDFSFSDILQKTPDEANKEREKSVLGGAKLPKQRVKMDNLQTRALERGGLQLSTYAWNFAPYLAYLKRHIGSNIYPPRAFDLGLIDGTTRVKLRIWRNGKLDGPELIDFEGNVMLRDTSIKAVELSAPFKSLPPDFPDDYLDIVGTFEYLILRDDRGRQ